MSHPTRVRVLTFLNEGEATPKELADRVGESASNVWHHLNVLLKLGCIELVGTDEVRGGRASQNRFRATRRAYLDEEAWEELGGTEKLEFLATLLRLVSEDINEAMLHGTFYDPDDNHLSRTPMVVDPEGWLEVVGHLDHSQEGLSAIQGRIHQRNRDDNGTMFPIKVEILQFRSPKLAD